MILVVGGSKGLGFEIAKVFSEKKDVKVIGRNFDKFPKNTSIEKIILDIVKAENNFHEIDNQISQKTIEAVFFTIGLVKKEDNLSLEPKKIDELVNTNFSSIVKFNQFLINNDKLKEDCLICFCSSVTTFYSRDKQIIYAAAKHALNSYVDSLRFHVLKQRLNFRITNLILGYLDSEMSNISYSAPLNKLSTKKLAKYIFKNYKKFNSNEIIPRYWFLIKVLLRFIPIKIVITIFRFLKI